jgi:hypothetical protein
MAAGGEQVSDTTATEVDSEPTQEDIEALELEVTSTVQAAYDASQKEGPDLQLARPVGDWNLWARGPVGFAYGRPTKIIRVGERFRLEVVVWLNPAPKPGGPSACESISTTACDCELHVCTVDVCKSVPGPRDLSPSATITLRPNVCTYSKVFVFQARPGWEGLYETNITAVIRGCNNKVTPYAGFVTRVFDFVPDIFYPTPPGVGSRWEFDIPIKFMITA